MLSFRRRIRSSLKEWLHGTLRDKIVILCSNPAVVAGYVRLKHLINRITIRP